MSMPSGDTPQKVDQIYHYLNAHQIPRERAATWHIDWPALIWMWGSAIALLLLLLLWIRQYRTTRQRTGISPLDDWGGHTTEAAGPATLFFLFLTAGVLVYVGVIIVGHLAVGQLY
jgi:hypothetical protein